LSLPPFRVYGWELFNEHKGRRVVYPDFSQLSNETESLQIIEEARRLSAKQTPDGSLLTLTKDDR
jgi:hypothetical protein